MALPVDCWPVSNAAPWFLAGGEVEGGFAKKKQISPRMNTDGTDLQT